MRAEIQAHRRRTLIAIFLLLWHATGPVIASSVSCAGILDDGPNPLVGANGGSADILTRQSIALRILHQATGIPRSVKDAIAAKLPHYREVASDHPLRAQLEGLPPHLRDAYALEYVLETFITEGHDRAIRTEAIRTEAIRALGNARHVDGERALFVLRRLAGGRGTVEDGEVTHATRALRRLRTRLGHTPVRSPLFRGAGADPVVVAHGKNENVAVESTWANLAHSVRSGAQVLEVDLHMTSDGRFVVMHDPTFHGLVHDYRTNQAKVDAFQRAHPEIWRNRKGDWTDGLVDRAEAYTLEELQRTIRFRDTRRNVDVRPLSLTELLAATRESGKFHVPAHEVTPAGGRARREGATSVDSRGQTVLYLDMKDLNAYARRLQGLPDNHDWIRDNMGSRELRALTERAIRNLSRELKDANGYDRVFITARHPLLARMIREIDPKIRIMASPEGHTRDTPVAQVLRDLQAFAGTKPDLIELKYLPHILSPEIRQLARDRGWKILYNQIAQTDRAQFEGRYRDRLRVLLGEIMAEGQDILIQTNTVQELRRFIDDTQP